MKTLVGVLLTTIVLAAGYREAEAHGCKSKHMKHRCACNMETSTQDVINAKSYGGYMEAPATPSVPMAIPPVDESLEGGSPLMPDTFQNREQLNPSGTMPMMDDQLNNNNSKDFEQPIIDNGWENSGSKCKNK